jgi:hypothetical protein
MKVRISITETLKYQEELVVIQPDNMTDSEFEAIIDGAEKQCSSADDMSCFLDNYGIETVGMTKSFPDSPYYEELEIDDLTNIKD